MLSSYAMSLSKIRRWMLHLVLVATGAALLIAGVAVCLFPDWLDDVRSPFRCPLGDIERQLLARTLQAVTSALDAANVTYFMMSGTLLGSYRHHDRIPWDDDVDLIVPMSEQARVKAAVRPLEPEFRLISDAATGYQWKFFVSAPTAGSHRAWFSFRSWSIRWPFIDVFFYERNATHLWNTCPWFPDEVWPLRAIFPLRRRPFGHLSLPAPCDTATTLAVNFDTTRCRPRDYDHVRNSHNLLWLRTAVEVDCSSLETMWPFVRRRRWTDRQSGIRHVTETLWAPGGQYTLSEITLVDQCL